MIDMPLAGLLISISIFVVAIAVHEVAHGWVAYKLGDPTAKYMGRLTINPLAHIDPIGTVILPILLIAMRSPVIFGWAKPVPINFLNLRRPKRDMIWVGLAGPLANVALAFFVSSLLRFFPMAHDALLQQLIVTSVLINLVLAVFNLIPVPPLDGSRILFGLLPRSYAFEYMRLENYGFLLILILLYFGLVDRFIWPAVIILAKIIGIEIS